MELRLTGLKAEQSQFGNKVRVLKGIRPDDTANVFKAFVAG
jgi:hypothetical protein